MMLRAPKFTFEQLEALRTLLRLDFSRAVKYATVQSRQEPLEPLVESIHRQLRLSDMFTDHEQPILVTLALMEMHGADTAQMPLVDQKFEFYSGLVNKTQIHQSDFPSIPAESFEDQMAPLRELQGQLQKVFSEAAYVDRVAMEKGLPELDAQPAKAFVN